MMNGFQTYQLYVALKTHFTKKEFDFFKYGTMRIKFTTFLARRDKLFFDRLANKFKDKEIFELFVSNLLEDRDLWIGDLLNKESQTILRSWRKRRESLEYIFMNDLDTMFGFLDSNGLKFDDLFSSKNTHPLIFKMLLRKEISPETYSLVDILLDFSEDIQSRLELDPVWNDVGLRYQKYNGFINISDEKLDKFRQLVVDKTKEYDIL